MSVSIPDRNHGATLVLAVLFIGLVMGTGWSRNGGPPDPVRLLENFKEAWLVGALAYGYVVGLGLSWHGFDKSPEGHRPIGSLFVLITLIGLGFAASAGVIVDMGGFGHHIGVAKLWAYGLWFLIAFFGASFTFAKLGRGKRPKRRAFSMPSIRRRPASPFVDMRSLGGH